MIFSRPQKAIVSVSFHVQKKHATQTTANEAELIRGGRDYFRMLKKLIDEAGHTIHLQFYIFDPDTTGKQIGSALIEAAQRGVRVYILLDAYGSQKLSRNFIKRWKDSGIYFRWFQPLFKSRKFYLGRRLHHKVVVVDGDHSLVSGLNISDRYNDMPGVDAWLDWALYCRGEVSLQLEDVCRRRLKLRLPKSHPKHITDDKPREITVRINDWVGRRQEITRMYLKMLREARQQVVIMTPYFMPGHPFRRSLKRAVKRGVQVQMILTAHSDVPVAKYAERYLYEWLLRNNIEIWEYQKNVLHGKIAIADKKWATVGSYNVNNLSAYASIELNLEVIDADLVNTLSHRLKQIKLNECIRITEAVYRKQSPWLARLAQRIAYGLFRFMLFIFTLRIRQPE